MVVKAVYIDCKNLKLVGVNAMRVFVVHFRVYVSREFNVESLWLVHLGFSFLVSWLYIVSIIFQCLYAFPLIFDKVLFLSLNNIYSLDGS